MFLFESVSFGLIQRTALESALPTKCMTCYKIQYTHTHRTVKVPVYIFLSHIFFELPRTLFSYTFVIRIRCKIHILTVKFFLLYKIHEKWIQNIQYLQKSHFRFHQVRSAQI